MAENVAQYLHKGSLVGVEGRIQTRNYDDANGRRVYVTEVVAESVQFLEPKSASANRDPQPYGQPSYQSAPGYASGAQNYGSPAGGYQADVNTNSFANDFDSNDSLDIASDDLPF